MLSRSELESIAKKLGFNVYQAEKDYLQHVFLSALYAVSSIELVFKGGTALQKAFGLDRFSEDLDFTLNLPEGKDGGERADMIVRNLMEKAASRADGFARTTIGKTDATAYSVNLRLKMQGPLFAGSEKALQALTVQVSLRENLIRKPLAEKIIPVHPDLQPYVALVMAPEEMLAEKVRALTTRRKARDLYDIWFLLRKGVKFDEEMTNEKLSLSYDNGGTMTMKKMKYSHNLLKNAIADVKDVWTPELRVLLRSIPEFSEVQKYVLDAVVSGD